MRRFAIAYRRGWRVFDLAAQSYVGDADMPWAAAHNLAAALNFPGRAT